MVRQNLSVGLVLSLLVSVAFCGDVDLDVSVDRDRVAVGEPFLLTITVTGGGRVDEPTISNMEGFEIIGKSTSQSFSIINMQVSKSISFQYRIVPLNEGTYSIGPFSIKVDNTTYQAEPIEIVVVKSSAKPAPSATQRVQPQRDTSRSGGNDVLLIASVDKRKAYVGEQITYTLKFAYRVRLLSDPDYTPPEHQGFWSESIGEEGPDIEEINGEKYYVLTSRTAFFPITSGQYRIGEASVRFVAEEQRIHRDPFGLFGSDPFGFLGRSSGREGVVKSKPIDIEVLPLPKEGRPDDFTGAVGNFRISVEPSSQQVKVGESVTLLVRVEGEGNLRSIDKIVVPEIKRFRVFGPKPRDTALKRGKTIGGTKTFELILVPESPGTYMVNGFEFVYFDPSQARYVRTKSSDVTLSVLPGDGTYEDKAISPTYIARRDIRYIKTRWESSDDLKMSHGSLWSLISLGPIAIVACGAIVALVRRQAARAKRSTIKAGLDRALRDISKAHSVVEGGGDISYAAGLASQAIRACIAQKLGVSPKEIDISKARELGGISDSTYTDLQGILDSLDMVRFAPVGCDRQQVKNLLETAENILRRVRQEWRE